MSESLRSIGIFFISSSRVTLCIAAFANLGSLPLAFPSLNAVATAGPRLLGYLEYVENAKMPSQKP